MTSATHQFWSEPAGIRDQPDGATVTVLGELAYLTSHVSKQQFPYATAVIRSLGGGGELPITVMPRAYERVGALLDVGLIYTVTGRMDRRGEVHVLAVDHLEPTGKRDKPFDNREDPNARP